MGIKIRDQVRFPIAPDGKAMLAESTEEGGSYFMLLYDVKNAHRPVPVENGDWGRQDCRIRGSGGSDGGGSYLTFLAEEKDFTAAELAEQVFLNCVGTVWVTSAGYWLGRAGGAILRLTHYVLGCGGGLWALLYSDDGQINSSGPNRDKSTILHVFVPVVIGVPLSWKKFRGGVEAEWIGYLLDLARSHLGISVARAAWATRRLTDKAQEGNVRLGELQEGLARLQFLSGAIEFFRPFLGPLYAGAFAVSHYA